MNISTALRLPADSYFPEKHPKDLIVLHHTVGGSAKSTFEYWRTDEQHIGTAYIVDREGTIYEVFPPECWAYHLGLKTTQTVDKRSIGIEIASEGALLERGRNYYSFGRLTEATRYTGPVFDVDAEAPAPGIKTVSSQQLWRDYRYFAQYTPAALASVFALVDALLTRFSIPRQTPANHVDYNLAAYTNYKGVLTHCQLRSDKTDVHPGFAWEELVSACTLTMTSNIDGAMLLAGAASRGGQRG
jgi:N-acetyl-anhydromuramyl-L-alanine amidase AmpD